MISPRSFLSALKCCTAVDCDTLDPEVAKEFGPFHDCTSNQVIAFNELQNGQHEALIDASIDLAKKLRIDLKLNGDFQISLESLAVEVAMVKLSLRMAPHIEGYVHVQTNPFYSYSTSKTIQNARRILQLFQRVDPEFDTSRVCIKIPSTWEGLQACRTLQATGITTLATTLFTMAQAALAAEVGCHYIAPYLNELRTQIEEGYEGDGPLFLLVVSIQAYYQQHRFSTIILPASQKSMNEIMLLAGIEHMTIAPKLLRELASTESPNVPIPQSLFAKVDTATSPCLPKTTFVNNENGFRMAMTRNARGAGQGKLVQAINIFCEAQMKMEAMMKERGGV